MASEKTGLTRRKFLHTAAVGMAAGLAGFPQGVNAAAFDLAVISGEAGAATVRAINVLGGISRFVKKGQRVVIKPNMSFARTPDFAATTHPQVVAAVARACSDAGAKQVLVLDHVLQRPELCLERTGIRDACRNIPGVHVLAVQERQFFRETPVPKGKALESVEIIRDVLDSQVLINIPIAKSHSTTIVTMGLKNLMGLIWNRWIFHVRYDIDQAIVDLATVMPPHLTILDATRVLVTGGPGGPGEVHKPNLVIAGIDPVAVDAYGVGLAPWFGKKVQPKQVEHILFAYQRGLGRINLEKLNIYKGTG